MIHSKHVQYSKLRNTKKRVDPFLVMTQLREHYHEQDEFEQELNEEKLSQDWDEFWELFRNENFEDIPDDDWVDDPDYRDTKNKKEELEEYYDSWRYDEPWD